MWQQHLLCASCGILCRGTDELLSTGRRIRPSLRRSSNYCTKQQAENGRDRALIQYLKRQGVLMTPCLFYFGCYIDTLCGRPLRNRMSGAAARHFFFLEKVRTVSACIGINLPSQKTPRQRRGSANAADGGAGASIAQMYICTACRGYPGPQCRLRAEKLAAIRRRKEKHVDENKKEHHLHIVLTTQQYQLLCCQAKECRLTKRAYLARLIEGRPVKARPKKAVSSARPAEHSTLPASYFLCRR